MRFLCLHGLGTNSNIFEAQTARIREQLGPTYEFVFLDGEVKCDAAPGVSAIFPGPYLSWYPEIPTESELAAARELVLEVLEEDGPFDGLMGFSQGAALAASLVLQHSDQAQPLVDCAVFICGTLPWMLRSEVVPLSEKHSVTCQIDEVSDSETEIEGLLVVQGAPISIESIQNTPSNGYKDGSHARNDHACLLYPAKSALHFPIPTAHIHGGRKDRYFELSKALFNLGSETHGVKVFDHDAGHVIPRGGLNTSRMAEIVSWVAEKVIWRC